MKIEHLSLEHQVKTFDCGDSDLNYFLQNDAILFFEKRIASTYVLEDMCPARAKASYNIFTPSKHS